MLNLLNFQFTLTRGADFHFFHGPAIYAFIRDRLDKPGTPFPKGLSFLPVESGRVFYYPHSRYNIPIVFHYRAEIQFPELVELLCRQPCSCRGRNPNAPLGSGMKLDKIIDCVTGEPIHPTESPKMLNLMDLEQPIEKILSGRTIKIRFDSPLLIPRTPIAKGTECFDGDVFDPGQFLSRVKEMMGEQFRDIAPEGAVPPVRLLSNRLVRTDSSYPKKRLVGSRGTVELEFPKGMDEFWAASLLLTGTIGIGRTTAMGQGRFSVIDAPVTPYWPPKPAQTFLERAAHPENMEFARESMISAGKSPGVDDVELEQFLEGLTYRLDQYQTELVTNTLDSQPLKGILLRKPDGRMRPLAIPTMKDRFLQRAVMQELAPAVDQLIEDSSFAYRKGLSRSNARHSIQMAREEGYEYVFESDIRTFFDEVDWEQLENRLRAYFGDDPVVEALMKWVRAPVSYANNEIKRDRGLPQGAVVSPLLANLYLDAFDEGMQARGFRLIRYADDFVILCKKPEDAERAHEAVLDELEKLRLTVSDQKTSETSFGKGFKFLGYLFCRSVVLNSPADKSVLVPVSNEDDWLESTVMDLDDHQVSGWLANAVFDMRRDIDESDPVWKKPGPAPNPEKRPVYIIDPSLKIGGGRKGLRIYEKKDKLKAQIPWDRILEISISGGWNFTSGMINQAMKHNIPVAFYTRSGNPRGKLLPQGSRDPSPMAVMQYRWMMDESNRLSAAKSLIESKIHNQRLLVRRQPGNNERLREVMKDYAQDVIRCESIDKLRGFEGQAAHAYFSHWDEWVKPDFKFENRTARGAEDPVNVMLNFLYTQLFRICQMALLSEGLDAFAGIMHEGKGRYAALAADIQEPFRFLCERLVLDLIRRHRAIESDFVYREKFTPRLVMKDHLVRLVIEEWEKRLESTVGAGNETKTYRKHIYGLAYNTRKMILENGTELQSFRMKW